MQRIFVPLALFLFFLPACHAQDVSQGQQTQALPPIQVYFSPKGGCTEAVVKQIDAAKTSIFVQAYSFTSAPIAKALLDAHKRGVQIQVILDTSNRREKYSSADFVLHAGIPTFIDAKHAIAHNKVMVVDETTVITGSFNFTKQAETSNAENLLVIRSPELARKYAANWQAHLEHSEKYEEKEKGYSETHRAATEPPSKTDAAVPIAGGFVASVNSQVFHRADCKSTAKISAKNIIHYNSRDEAEQAGKKACSECRP
jgi:phosphatidylserine/phosphatidylglycerophosphate/cardiolipin synthase-like enzyme